MDRYLRVSLLGAYSPNVVEGEFCELPGTALRKFAKDVPKMTHLWDAPRSEY